MPLLIPLPIPYFVHYHSIVKTMNVSWASIIASRFGYGQLSIQALQTTWGNSRPNFSTFH